MTVGYISFICPICLFSLIPKFIS